MQLSMLANVIKAEGLTGTAAEIQQALTIKSTPVSVNKLRSSKETLVALKTAGLDAEAVSTAVKSTTIGQMLLDKLSVEGVNWIDPLTIDLMDELVVNHPDFSEQAKTALMGMNQWDISICQRIGIGDPSIAQVQTALNEIAVKTKYKEISISLEQAVNTGSLSALKDALQMSADSVVL